MTKMTKVVNVKVKYLRKNNPNPKYNLKDWCEEDNNIYVGRGGIVFVPGKEHGSKERYPKKGSIWANPFKVGKNCFRQDSIKLYKEYIIDKIIQNPKKYDLRTLKGKNLGCWCHPERCHADILLELITEFC